MKKIKIGDHEITIGPEVVTIEQSGEHTINPTTDMVIITKSMNRETYLRFPISLTIGQGAYEGQKLTFVVKAYDDSITTTITINGISGHYIDGQTIEIVYNGGAWNYISVSDVSVNINDNFASIGKLYDSKMIQKARFSGTMSKDSTSITNYNMWTATVNKLPNTYRLIHAEGTITVKYTQVLQPFEKIITFQNTAYWYNDQDNKPLFISSWFERNSTRQIGAIVPNRLNVTSVSFDGTLYFALA